MKKVVHLLVLVKRNCTSSTSIFFDLQLRTADMVSQIALREWCIKHQILGKRYGRLNRTTIFNMFSFHYFHPPFVQLLSAANVVVIAVAFVAEKFLTPTITADMMNATTITLIKLSIRMFVICNSIFVCFCYN